MAAATLGPGSDSPMSPTSYSFVAPYEPRAGAAPAAPGPHVTASTAPPNPRAAVSSSRTIERGTPSFCSARTQILFTSVTLLQDFELLEETDHALMSVAFVDDDLAGFASLGRLDRDD